MRESHQMLIDHAQSTAKIFAGGGIVGGGTYVAVDSITHVTEIATCAAAVMTALYFAANFILACVKIYKEAKRD